MLKRARVIKQGCKYLIALVVRTRVSTLLKEKTLKKALRSLYNVTLELNLKTISISKTDVDNVSWVTIQKFLREFYDSTTKIIVCDNCISIPETSNRIKIIAKNHA